MKATRYKFKLLFIYCLFVCLFGWQQNRTVSGQMSMFSCGQLYRDVDDIIVISLLINHLSSLVYMSNVI